MKHITKFLKYRLPFLFQTKKERRHAMVGPALLWKMKRNFQIEFLKAVNLRPEHVLLDIGCGTLRGGIPLIAYLQDGHYFGIEVRAEVLNEGRKELREADLEDKNPTLLLCSDISQFRIDQRFDFVWAFSVLIHMTDDILGHTLAVVGNHLSEEGVFYANVNIGKRDDGGDWQGFPVVSRSFEFYSRACAEHALAVSDLGHVADYGHIPEPDKQDSHRMLRITKKDPSPATGVSRRTG